MCCLPVDYQRQGQVLETIGKGNRIMSTHSVLFAIDFVPLIDGRNLATIICELGVSVHDTVACVVYAAGLRIAV